jgi:hypothetical protein
MVADHQRTKPDLERLCSDLSAKWTVTLLESRQTVVEITSGSDSTAAVGPDWLARRKVK